jgi:isocitrate/isopropylmalate dehydrogenase
MARFYPTKDFALLSLQRKVRVRMPKIFCDRCNVIVTTNLLFDMLSKEMVGLVWGIGMATALNIAMDVANVEAVYGGSRG